VASQRPLTVNAAATSSSTSSLFAAEAAIAAAAAASATTLSPRRRPLSIGSFSAGSSSSIESEHERAGDASEPLPPSAATSTTSSSSPAVSKRSKERAIIISSLSELQDTGVVLGAGSSGVVKRLIHIPTGTPVAVKVREAARPRADDAERSMPAWLDRLTVAGDLSQVIPLDVAEDLRKKVLQELRTLHRCSHPGIVEFLGAFYQQGQISIVLEYMDGGTLEDIIKQVGAEGIPEPILGKMALQLLDAIEYIHKELHIVHRDIKVLGALACLLARSLALQQQVEMRHF